MHAAFSLIFYSFAVLCLNVLVAKPNQLSPCDFQGLFHKIAKTPDKKKNTTTLRKELKVVVDEKTADRFIKEITQLLGDDKPDVQNPRMVLRDKPDSPDKKFITNTDYLPVFESLDSKGSRIFKGVIRIRNYIIANKTDSVSNFENTDPKDFEYSKIADGEGPFAKLEFKVGHPELTNPDGILKDLPGVVDKPGVTLARADIALLLQSPESFKTNQARILKRGKSLKLTLNGETKPVNDPVELADMIERIGKMHEMGWGVEQLHPDMNIRYVRTARQVKYPQMKGDVQITVDEDIRAKNIKTGEIIEFRPQDRVIELKIPKDFADLSDQDLRGGGLEEIVQLRSKYLALPTAEGTIRDRGKRFNVKKRDEK